LRATTSHRRGFPCFDDFLFHACRRHYPGGIVGCCRYLAQRQRPSLKTRQVGFRNFLFEAGHRPQGGPAFTHVPACMVAKSPKVTRYTRELQRITLPPASPWLLPAERPMGRMGFAPTGDRRLSRRTRISARLTNARVYDAFGRRCEHIVNIPARSIHSVAGSATAEFILAPEPEWLPKFDFQTSKSPLSMTPF
jgi:hypothetical protein